MRAVISPFSLHIVKGRAENRGQSVVYHFNS